MENKIHIYFNVYLEKDSEIKEGFLYLYIKPNKDFDCILSTAHGLEVTIVTEHWGTKTNILDIIICDSIKEGYDYYSRCYYIYKCELTEDIKNILEGEDNSPLLNNCRLIVQKP